MYRTVLQPTEPPWIGLKCIFIKILYRFGPSYVNINKASFPILSSLYHCFLDCFYPVSLFQLWSHGWQLPNLYQQVQWIFWIIDLLFLPFAGHFTCLCFWEPINFMKSACASSSRMDTSKSSLFIFKFVFIDFRERKRKREREREMNREKWICCCFHCCIHWLILVCALAGGWTHNLGILGMTL